MPRSKAAGSTPTYRKVRERNLSCSRRNSRVGSHVRGYPLREMSDLIKSNYLHLQFDAPHLITASSSSFMNVATWSAHISG